MAGGAGRIGRGGRRAESTAVRRAESTAVRLAEFTGHPEFPGICPAGPLNGDFPILTLRGPQEKTVPRKPPTEKPATEASPWPVSQIQGCAVDPVTPQGRHRWRIRPRFQSKFANPDFNADICARFHRRGPALSRNTIRRGACLCRSGNNVWVNIVQDDRT